MHNFFFPQGQESVKLILFINTVMAYIAVLNTLKPEQGSTVFYICGIV